MAGVGLQSLITTDRDNRLVTTDTSAHVSLIRRRTSYDGRPGPRRLGACRAVSGVVQQMPRDGRPRPGRGEHAARRPPRRPAGVPGEHCRGRSPLDRDRDAGRCGVRTVARHAGLRRSRHAGASPRRGPLRPLAVRRVRLASRRAQLPTAVPRRKGIPRERVGGDGGRARAGTHLRAPLRQAAADRGRSPHGVRLSRSAVRRCDGSPQVQRVA